MHRNAEEIELLLRERGLSLTPQRRAIVRRLAEHGGHWSAAEVLESVTGEFPMASRATVYSTLALLRDLGVVVALPAPGGELRFDANPEPHHHFVCLHCGQLEDIPDGWFEVTRSTRAAPTFKVDRFQVIAEGVCVGCLHPTEPTH
jgi:Fur family transcriptional regulator, peroxide stress response regulator